MGEAHKGEWGDAVKFVRSALQSAQQEVEAWEAVQAWLTADVGREFMICRLSAGFKAYLRYGCGFEKTPIFNCHDSARAALLECAAWCRAQEVAP